jgi:hypothetical protein
MGTSMTQSSPGSGNPFVAARHAEAPDGRREPVRTRRISLPLLMDDGQLKSFDLPSALEHPTQFSAGELQRLSRAYAQALKLIR